MSGRAGEREEVPRSEREREVGRCVEAGTACLSHIVNPRGGVMEDEADVGIRVWQAHAPCDPVTEGFPGSGAEQGVFPRGGAEAEP